MKNINRKTGNRGHGKLKERIITFFNRTFNSIQCAYMALKSRYNMLVTFKITGNKNGLLIGYFIVK